MALSGTKTFKPDAAEIMEEAYEQAGLEMRTGYDARTARRSINLLLLEWANNPGINQWTVSTNATQALTSGTATYALDNSVMTILDGSIRTGSGTNQNDVQLTEISRSEYTSLPTKNATGKPSQYFVDRGVDNVTIYLWPVPDSNSYTFVYDAEIRMDDVTASVHDLQIPNRFYSAFVAGLAAKIALKKNPQKYPVLLQIYEVILRQAEEADQTKAPYKLVPSSRSYRVVN